MNPFNGARQQPAFDREMLHQILDAQQRLTGGMIVHGKAHSTQATSWSVATRRNGGVAAVQTGIANSHRAANRHPSAGSNQLRPSPAISAGPPLPPAPSDARRDP